MSYSINFKLYKDGELKVTAYADYLKNVNKRRYAADLEIDSCRCEIKIPDDVEDHYAKWYDENSFSSAIEKYNTERDRLEKDLFERKKVKISPAYYSFYTAEDKEELNDHIEYLEELIKELNWKIEACSKMLGVIELYNGNIITGKDEDGDNICENEGDIKILIYAV